MVTVIIPAFNCESTISQAIFSALHQTVSPLEVIVIDDGSTDQTYRSVEQMASIEHRIRLYKNSQNCGVAETRNIGCSYAQGKYIAFLDGDDTWEKDKLEKQLQKLEQTQAGICYTSYHIVSSHFSKTYTVPVTIDYEGLLKENVILCSTVVLRAEMMKIQAFDPAFFHEDYALWLTLLRKGYQAVGIQEPLVYYQKGGRSSDKMKAAKNRWRIYRRAVELPFLQSCRYMFYYGYRGLRKYAL